MFVTFIADNAHFVRRKEVCSMILVNCPRENNSVVYRASAVCILIFYFNGTKE
jgi:hypothetical protein